jgi:multidrug resistance efflux pump
VKKGQVIARLDRDQLVAQRDARPPAWNRRNRKLAQAETSLDWEKDTLAADIEQRRADLASNEARLAELKNGSRPQEIQDAKAAVDSAQSEVRALQERLGPRADAAAPRRRHLHRAIRSISAIAGRAPWRR